MSERKLASIQKVIYKKEIEGADNIELCGVLGWQVVSKKNENQVEDLVVYFEVDSVLPVEERYEFLRKGCFVSNGIVEGFRLRTIRLRGQISQGLVLPLSMFPEIKDVEIGQDVTELMKVEKFERPIPAELAGEIKGSWPSFLIRTDETRIQQEPDLTEKLKGFPYYISVKMDGTSSTFYSMDGEFGVCSRNLDLKENDTNTYWKIAKKYNIKNILSSTVLNLCIQGEICGPGIQKNPLNLKDHELFVFNVFNINTRKYFTFSELIDFCATHNLQTVPIEEEGDEYPAYSKDELLDRADGYYAHNPTAIREGIVVRSQNAIPDGYGHDNRLSFKVISNKYLLKHGDL